MELMFNELSVLPLSQNRYSADKKMIEFCEAIKAAGKNNFRKIRTNFHAHQLRLAEDYNLQNWLYNKQVPQRFRDLIFGIFITPFINDDDEPVLDQYINAYYFFEDSENGIAKTECLGLASAYLYETLSISLQSAPIWNQLRLSVIIEEEEENRTVDVFNISNNASFNEKSISNFVEALGDLSLNQSEISPTDKSIHISDHHGKAELEAFCNKLKHCPYVLEMKSAEWGGRRFIRKINNDGTIEIVLLDEERRYGLWVQTTGKNYRETKAIAEKIEEEYS